MKEKIIELLTEELVFESDKTSLIAHSSGQTCPIVEKERFRLADRIIDITRPKKGVIEFENVLFWFEYRLAKKSELCLATKNPYEYCNGTYAYSDKDPGNGMAFVVIKIDGNFNNLRLVKDQSSHQKEFIKFAKICELYFKCNKKSTK